MFNIFPFDIKGRTPQSETETGDNDMPPPGDRPTLPPAGDRPTLPPAGDGQMAPVAIVGGQTASE